MASASSFTGWLMTREAIAVTTAIKIRAATAAVRIALDTLIAPAENSDCGVSISTYQPAVSALADAMA